MNVLILILNWAIPTLCAAAFGFVAKELKNSRKHNNAMNKAMLSVIRSQLVSKCENYLNQGYLPEYARYCLEDLFNQYKALRWKSWYRNFSGKMF